MNSEPANVWSAPDVPALPREPGDTSSVEVFNTSTGSLTPVGADGRFSMYVCGITPYDATHMGHAATYVAFDVLNRLQRDAGNEVAYVQNVTDIDDPLLERASLTGDDWSALARRETALFFEDMQALRVLPPDSYVSAILAIPEVIASVQDLISRDFVYPVDGDWYFRADKQGHLSDVAHLSVDLMATIFAQRGGDPDRPGKESPLDCLVWMSQRPGEPAWPSPWGPGRPGWHIECTSIALNRLPSPFDVQGGGSDLAFPHHDMGNTQAIALTGKPLARAFVHAGMIGLDGEKMSKSRGNLVLVSKLRAAGVDAMAVRLALLAGHYRADRDWTADLLESAQRRLGAWRTAQHIDAADVLADVRAALRSDLDTPSALSIIDELAASSPESGLGNGSIDRQTTSLRVVVDALLGVAL